jgi:hypothetical protein
MDGDEQGDHTGREPPLTDVLATVITFQPGADLVHNLKALRRQVATVLVIDNGSADFASVERAALATECQVMRNRDNLGISRHRRGAQPGGRSGARPGLCLAGDVRSG